MLLADKFPEIFLKDKGCFFISESFALNRNIFVALTNKKLFSHYDASLNEIFFLILKNELNIQLLLLT